MKVADLKTMIRKIDGTGYDEWKNDIALKIYFYPLASALLTEKQWDEVMQIDDLTAKPNQLPKIVKWLSKKLSSVVRSLHLETETYLSVIVYGLLVPEGNEVVDLVFNLTETGEGNVQLLEPIATNKQLRRAG